MDKKRKTTNQRSKKVYIIGLVVIDLICISVFSSSLMGNSKQSKSMLQKAVPLFKVEGVPLSQAIGDLADQVNLPICLERVGVPNGIQEVRFEVSLQMVNTTLKEVLDTLVKQDPRYFWNEDNGIINFLPREAKDDKAYPLNRKLTRFKVDATPLLKTIDILIKQAYDQTGLTHKQFSFRFAPDLVNTFSASASYQELMTIDLRDATLRSIVNAIVKQIGDCRWDYRGFDNGSCYFVFIPLSKRVMAKREKVRQGNLHPKIFFQEKEYDFGEVIQGDKIIHTFKFENIGVGPLEINKVVPSRGCPMGGIFGISAGPFMLAQEFMPSQEGTLKVTFDSKGREWPQLYTIEVYSNDPDNPVMNLTMHGTVVAK